MGLFDKEKLKGIATKAKNSVENAMEEAKEREALGYLKDINIKLEYKGGHPNLTKEKDASVLISNDFMKISYGISEGIISYKDIISIHLETQEQIGKRITATRLLTLGVFSLAFKKKTKDVTKYLTIDFGEPGLENTVVLGGKYVADSHARLLERYQNYLARNPKEEIIDRESENVTVDPYEEIKKAKELLDMGIITEEEFQQKKKELLNL